MKVIENGVCAAIGFKAGSIHCGIRKNQTKDDLALIVSDTICQTAAVYTKNKVKAAPILVTKTFNKWYEPSHYCQFWKCECL